MVLPFRSHRVFTGIAENVQRHFNLLSSMDKVFFPILYRVNIVGILGVIRYLLIYFDRCFVYKKIFERIRYSEMGTYLIQTCSL